MSQENQSFLRFSLEESLWFRKGQEVAELISISLDPDITIQENDQYVTIRGSLELTGEYKSSEESSEEGNESITSQKFVETVAEREEGNCEFSHRFPVDITIPNNRVKSIYDIDVLVDSFDYSLPERSCIKLAAELTISGLYGSEQKEQEPELETLHRGDDVQEEETTLLFEEYPVEDSFDNNLLFETEARKEQEEPPEEVYPTFPTFPYQPEEAQAQEEEDQQPLWNLQAARSEGNQPKEVEVEEQAVVEEKAPIEVIFEKEEVAEEESSSSSSPEEPKHAKKKGLFKKKSMSLTEFFARKDEQSSQAKLKVCIVQKGDTADSIAERYDVTVQNLLRMNQLELNQDVYEGQVLYIPQAFANK